MNTSIPTETTPPPPVSGGAGRRWALRAAVALGVLAGAAGLGWLAGHAWWRWWQPAPDGVVYETTDGLRWIPDPIDAGAAQMFSATGEYVVIGAGLGVVLGVLVALLSRGWEVLGLLVGLVAAGLAAYVMVAVGTDLSPTDPDTIAEEAGAGAELPGALQVPGWSPHVSWPAGLLVGHLAVTLLAPRRRRRPSGESVGREPVARDVGRGE